MSAGTEGEQTRVGGRNRRMGSGEGGRGVETPRA